MVQPHVEMSVFEAILARRSVRSYAPQEVEAGMLRTLLEAAVRAPTAMHEEPWAFAIIQDRQQLRSLSDRAKPLFMEQLQRSGHSLTAFNHPEFNVFYDAGTLVIICGRVNGPFVAADCWLAAENMMLAACAMGLGTCVIGAALPALNMGEVKDSLGIPDSYNPVVPIVVGFPAGVTAPTARKLPLILTKH